eukprot:11214064-Lingulodinium_polyedra.AAC.1
MRTTEVGSFARSIRVQLRGRPRPDGSIDIVGAPTPSLERRQLTYPARVNSRRRSARGSASDWATSWSSWISGLMTGS